jgi:delta-aminolevulinic acid dehydratase/porphobilinogen synthase
MQMPIRHQSRLSGNDCHADVALDPYSIYGHDGIIANGDVENDSTNDACKMAVTLKQVPTL